MSASRSSGVLRTVVHQDRRWALTIGAVLPTGAKVASVRLDGHRHDYRVVSTARGREVLVSGGHGRGRTTLRVALR